MQRLNHRSSRPLFVATALAVICIASVLKGWMMFFTIPSLIISIPVIVSLQILAHLQVQRRVARPPLLKTVDAQLVSATLCYLFLPGGGDDSLWWILPSIPLTTNLYGLINSAVVYVLLPFSFFLTLTAFLLLRKKAIK
jgi:apolipoprotein N-acyltransferase